MEQPRRTPFVVGGMVALLTALVVWQVWFPGREFDAELWLTKPDDVRHDMAVRLLARDALIGKTRDEVVGMLGEPIERDEFHPDPTVLVYQLGPNRAFPIAMDSEWLSVILGPDGRVRRCKLWED